MTSLKDGPGRLRLSGKTSSFTFLCVMGWVLQSIEDTECDSSMLLLHGFPLKRELVVHGENKKAKQSKQQML